MIEYQCDDGHEFAGPDGGPKLTACQHYVAGKLCPAPIHSGHYTAKLGEWKADA